MNANLLRTSFFIGVTTLFPFHSASAMDTHNGQILDSMRQNVGASEQIDAASDTSVRTIRSVPMFLTTGQNPILRTIEKPTRIAQSDAPPAEKIHAKLGFQWLPETRSAIADLSTGCLSTSTRGLRDTFSFSVDKAKKALRIDGDYWHSTMMRIGSADCMKATTRRLQIDGILPGTYEIVRNGRIVGTVELAEHEIKKRYQ